MLIGSGEGGNEGAASRDGLLDTRLVFDGVPGRTREEVLEEIAGRVAREGFVRDPGELVRRLLERERLGCTGLGGGIAIPHCKLRDLAEVVVALASTAVPVDFAAADGVPVDLIFLVASPPEAAAAHLQALARLSRLLRTPGVVDGLRRAGSPGELCDVIRGAAAALPVTP